MKQRILSMAILPEGEAIFSERGYTVTIEDDAGGEFLKLTSHQDDRGCITFDPGEWPEIRELVEKMVAEINNNDAEKLSKNTQEDE